MLHIKSVIIGLANVQC